MLNLRIKEPKILFFKIIIIFVPIYLIAYFTQNMVYILPTLAVGLLFGANIHDGAKTDDSETDADASD